MQVLCLNSVIILNVCWMKYRHVQSCMYLPVSCLYLACIWPVSCLYFFAPCCIFLFYQATDLWMLAVPLHRCSITNASQSHRCRIAVAGSHHSCSASFAKCRLLDDLIGISRHSFSSGLWAEQRWQHFKACRLCSRIVVTQCTGVTKQLYRGVFGWSSA